MTYRVTMIVTNRNETIVTRFAGCVDADDAKVKARKIYQVVAFKKVEAIDE